jgi:hypothetical protein
LRRVYPLSELKSGESFEANDPAANLQYAGFRASEAPKNMETAS